MEQVETASAGSIDSVDLKTDTIARHEVQLLLIIDSESLYSIVDQVILAKYPLCGHWPAVVSIN